MGSIACIVSPLVALMRDLKAKFHPRGVSAEFLGELHTDAHAITRVTRGEQQLVFVSPESILDNLELRSMLYSTIYKESLVAVVIDEANWFLSVQKAYWTIWSCGQCCIIPSIRKA